MAIVSALPGLIDTVSKYFVANSIDADVSFGRNRMARQPVGTSGSVTFAPDPDGRAGKLSGARLKSNSNGIAGPRPIVTWERFFVVSVWAVDRSDKENEIAQFVAFENLFEALVNATLGFGHADLEWGDPTWNHPDVERFYGYAALIPFTLRGALFAPEPLTRNPTLVITKNPSLT